MSGPKKQYGQNFLINETVLNKIINANDLAGKTVIEIGPGRGALSKKLIEKAKAVYAFEIDKSLKSYLNPLEVNYPNFQVVYEDILKVDIDLFLETNGIDEAVCVANIPYYITGPIIEKLIQSKRIKSSTLMVQKEVSNRITATPNNREYGALTVLLGYQYEIRKITNVKNTSFFPAPKVDSAVIKLDRTSKYQSSIQDEAFFVGLVNGSFKQKRKTLLNNLSDYFRVTKQVLETKITLINPNFNPLIRAESLSVEDFIALSNNLYIAEKAYAKLNLSLEVTGVSGKYHDLESIVVPINLYDTLLFELADKDEVVSNIEIENNNIYGAIKLFKDTFNINQQVKITVDKKIPIGYGLGGSSADISATLRGLNRLFKLNKSLSELEPLANKLGSDTLFCLYNKRAFIYGRGDKIRFYDSKEKLKFLVIYPEVSLQTKEVFKVFDNLNEKRAYHGFESYLINEDYDNLMLNMKNDLLTASLKINESLKNLHESLSNEGLKIHMSGSGSALFLVNPTKDEKKKVTQILRKNVKFETTEEI
ncbi:MAG: 16S rRNA (adenine(1518)-N(6)/adenine(1519)-N(6))-dimethyltransferase RsmA [Acholeplasmataceae bacterium]|nr:16S rRNA (adenine(1518)-N(6)/adenine(1519)-N(6))-dimethyltransferase RsmA [Acholeplasmataceae bacterium]MDD4824006.1 16S rRNA (adenine(1518)-N(6)/adenine(1519)-N(6))-dimethyltransferase RsmA [Acholeplasmataceae bacterium]